MSWQKAPCVLGLVSPTLLCAKADTMPTLAFALCPSCIQHLLSVLWVRQVHFCHH